MGSPNLQIKREGGIVVATLNRPDKLNAIGKEIFDDLKSLMDLLETDKAAKVLVITGTGDKAFCVGADLKERQGMNEKDVLLRLDFVRTLYLRLERLPQPVIAAINGTALGGGLELALACDLRVASRNAILGLPEVDLAIIPGNGGTQRLARLVGASKAMELVLLAQRFTAEEALSLGVINRITPEGGALSAAMQMANRMLEVGPIALRQAKAAIRNGAERILEQGLTAEIEAYKACLYSKDRLEGLKAFSEKRKPVYRGE
jgi:enoyl-CoA hydratase/carnithine racemase